MPSKFLILHELSETHPDLRHEVAAKHKGALYDLFCRTPRCDGRVIGYWVEVGDHRGWSAEAECRYVVCEHCAVKGNWDVKASIPPTPEQVAKTKRTLEDKAEQARRAEAKALDEQIAKLQERRDELDPPKPIVRDAEPEDNAEPEPEA